MVNRKKVMLCPDNCNIEALVEAVYGCNNVND